MRVLVLTLLFAVTVEAQVFLPARKAAPSLPSSGIPYLFEEDFEAPGYEHTWTEQVLGSSGINDTFQPALVGDYSLSITNVANIAYTSADLGVVGQDEVWAYFVVKPVQILAAEAVIFQLLDVGNANQISIRVTGAAGQLKARFSAAAQVTTVNGMSAGTTYGVWVHWRKGTGADGFGSVGFSTTGTEPTSGNNYAEYTNSGSIQDVKLVSFGSLASINQTYIFDKLRIADQVIGNNPQ